MTPTKPTGRLRRLAVIVTLGALAVLPASTANVAAANASPAAVPAATDPSPTPSRVTLHLAQANNGVHTLGDNLVVTVIRRNDSAVAAPATELTVALGSESFTDRLALAAWFAGESGVADTAAVQSIVLPALSARSSQTERVTVPAALVAERIDTAGVYPVLARSPGSDSVAVGTVIVAPDTGLSTAVVVPVTAPPQAEGLLDTEALTELTQPGGQLAVTIAAVQPETILAIDPAIPAAIRTLGETAPESAQTWLQRLLDLPNPRFALQFGDADPAVQIRAGLTQPLTVSSLSVYRHSSAEPSPSATETAEKSRAPNPEPSDEVAPAAELLEIGDTQAETIFWPADVDADTLDALADDRTRILIPSERLTAGADGSAVPAHASVGEATVFAYDQLISAQLSAAAAPERTRVDPVHARAALAAHLALAAIASEGPVLLAVDRLPAPGYGLGAALQVIAEFSGFRPTTLAGLNETPGQPAELAGPAEQGTEPAAATLPAERVAELITEDSRVAEFASILADPSGLTSEQRAETLQLLAVAWTQSPARWQAAVREHRAATKGILTSVGILPGGPVRLLNAESGIQVWVRNDLPYPASLTLVAEPSDLRLNVERISTVSVQPASSQRIDIPVRARVGSGDITLSLYLLSPTGVPIGEEQTMDVSVRAEWEGVGLIVLGSLVGALVVLGAVRTIRRRRAPKKESAA